MTFRMMRTALSTLISMVLLLGSTAAIAWAQVGGPDVPPPAVAPQSEDDELDPIRELPFPCDDLEPALGLPARAEENLVHVANKCGLVGTDIEFQSRRAADGTLHDYAFVGSAGNGLRIFDITDPTNITSAGRYNVVGYQNDVQVRRNLAILTFDGLSGEGSNTSACFQTKFGSNGQGVEVIRLEYDRETARFGTSLLDCLANPPGGAHNSTLSPSGKWLAISNSSDWAVDVMDLTKLGTDEDPHVLRLIDASRRDLAGKCPEGASFRCIVMERPPAPNLGSDTTDPACRPGPCPDATSATGLFRVHDVQFSRNGKTAYVAALNSTFIVNVKKIDRFIAGEIARPTTMPTIAILNNLQGDDPSDITDPNNIELSHQADVSSDGRILVIGDEQGGGVTETGCQTDPQSGVVGALHFWAIGKIGRPGIDAQDPTPANPVRLGIWVSPNPEFRDLIPGVPDEEFLGDPLLAGRACTVHVFRLGGNGTASPGSIDGKFDGVSSFTSRRLSAAFYGAGVLFMDFSRRTPADSTGGVTITEHPATTWGITLGYNVQLGADTWSAKEYKGYIYTGDIVRGFDAYRITRFSDPVVTLDKTGPATATAGSEISYRLTYRNLGPAGSGEASVSDPLPPGLRFVSASDGGTFDGSTRTVSWALGTVGVGEADTLKLRVRIGRGLEPGATLTNRATYQAVATVSPPTAVWVTTVVAGAARADRSR